MSRRAVGASTRLDESLDVLNALWQGEPVDYDGDVLHVHTAPLLPTPVQQPRIPIWVAARWPGWSRSVSPRGVLTTACSRSLLIPTATS